MTPADGIAQIPAPAPALLACAVALLAVIAGAPRTPRTPAIASPRALPGTARHPRPTPLDIARLVERLATIIASGTAPRTAWSAAAEATAPGPLQDLARAVGAGADPARAAGTLTGSPEIAALSAALEVCERTGAPLGPVLLTLADGLRDVADAALARRSAFAGPLATARILLALPLAGIGLGLLLGADPLGLLLHGDGLWLLASGTACTLGGWWWMHRLLRAARDESPGVDPSLVLDLVAGPLAAGSPLAHALATVGQALASDPLAAPLERTARALAAGVGVRTALSPLPASLAPLRDAALVSDATGADLVGLLRSGARDARRGRARAAEAAAARLAVRLVLPTGIALLPAFVLLGIIPTVASLLDGSFAGVLG